MCRLVALCGLAIGLALGAIVRGDDLDIVAERIRVDTYSSSLSDTTTNGFLSSLGSDGRWSDVNYADTSQTNWSQTTHLSRMVFMASAYANPSHPLYQSAALLDGVRKAYDAFVTLDPKSTNWYYNDIWTPQQLGKTILLVQPQLTAAQISKGTAIIARSYYPRSFNAGTNTGTNRNWRAFATILRGAITRDATLTSEAFGAISDTLVTGTGEGVQADGSFHQHGPQMNNGSYGLSFSTDGADLSSYSVGTSFALPADSTKVLVDYLLDGQQWMLRGVSFEATAQGRGISRTGSRNFGSGIAGVVNQTLTLTSYRSDELTAMRNRLTAAAASGTASPELAFVGHKHFWRSDYTSHHRPGFSATVTVSSTRTLEPESGNAEGLKNLHLADGVNLIQQRGDEYTHIQPIWDWRRLPGTTTEQGTYSLKPATDWGVRGPTGFAGGVSDGRNGATVLDYSALNVKAHKSWFFFDDVQLALGSGIDAAAATYPVITTLNQTFQKGSVTYGNTSGSTGTLASGTQSGSDLSWVLHDGVGYVFPTAQNVTLQAAVQSGNWYDLATSNANTVVSGSVFSLQVNHGTAPSGGSYAYAVLPGASGSSVAAYAAAPAVRILSNSRNLQAARHDGLALTQAAFYTSGTLTTGSGATISVREPSLVMLDESAAGAKLSVSNPYGLATTLHADITRTRPESPDEFTRVTIRLSGSDQGGATVTRSFDQPAVRTFTYQLRDGAAAVAPLVYQWSFEGATAAERLRNSGTGANATLQPVAYGSEGSTAKIAYGLGVDETTTAMSPQRIGQLSSTAGGALLTTTGTVAIPNAFTVEALVRPDLLETGGSIGYAVMAGGAATNNRGYFLVNQEGTATDSTATIIGDSLSQADNVGRTIGSFVPGHWYYVANTYTVSGSQTTINSYVANLTLGEMSVTQAVAGQIASGRPLTAAQMAIGGYFASGTAQEAWSGSIDEVSIFGRVLTGAEVQARLDRLHQAPTQVAWSAAASGTTPGGSGTWSPLGLRWVSGTARLLPVTTAQVVFGGSAGTVAVTGAQSIGGGMTFTTDGYTLTGGTLSFTGSPAANTVHVLAGGSATLAATISGTGGITKNGDGTLSLAAGNDYSGDTRVAAGLLRLGHAGALGMSTFDTQSGTVGGFSFGTLTTATFGGLVGSNGLVLTNSATTPAGVTLAVGGNGRSTTFPGVISGLGGLTKIGPGTLTLTGTSTYAGTTTVSDGILTITSTAALPGFASAGRIAVADGGTLAVTNSVADSVVTSIIGSGSLARGGSFGFDTTAGDRTNTTPFAGSFGIAKIGTNTLTLSGSQSYTGPTTIKGGTLAFTSGRNQTLAGAITGSGAVFKSGSGTLLLTGSNSHTGGTLLAGGTLQIGSGGTTGWISGPITNGGAVVFNRSDSLDFSGSFSGSGSVVQAGGGQFTLSGSNSHSGGTWVTGTGSLAAASAAAFGSGTITLQSGQTSFNTVLDLTGGMTLANPIVLAQTAGNRNNIRISGTTMFSGPITVTGTGTGSDVFQNSTNTGQLTLAGNISAPSSFGGSLSFRYGRILITGTINASAATFDLNNGGTTIVSSTGNAWNLIRFAGTSTDNLLQLGADNALATAAPVEFNTTSSGGGIDMNGFDQSLPGFYNTAGSSTAPLSRIFNNGGSDATLTLAGLTANRWSNVALADGTGGGKLALVMNSPGRMQTLASASSSYTGGTTILAGTIALGHESGLGTGTLTANDGTFDLAGYSPTVGGLSGSSTGLITSGSTGAVATLTVSSDVSSTFAGQIQNGAGTVGLVKSGPGTLTLTGPSTYTGATTVSAGTLALSGGSNRLPTATTLAFAGGTVAMNGVAQTVAGLSVANSMAAAIIGTGSAPSAITSSTGIVLGGGSGTSTLLLQPLSEGAFTVSATPGITINAGGELQLGVYGYTTGTFTNPNANVGASGTGTPVTISGGSLTLTPMRTNAGQTAVGSPNAAYNRVGGLTMSSGLISMSLAVNGDRRLSVYGPLAITGGTVASSASGGTIELFSYANLLSPAAMSNGISISQFMPTTGTSASLTAGVPLTGGLAVRSGVGTFTLTSSVAGQNVGAIQLGDNSATPGAGTTLRLGSNLGLIANAPSPPSIP